MNHYAAPTFWEAFGALDPAAQKAARAAFNLMKTDPRHPSVRLKKTGRFWSARAGRSHRAVAVERVEKQKQDWPLMNADKRG